MNNLLNTQNIAGVTAGPAAVQGVAYTAAPSDVLSSLTPGELHDDGNVRVLADA